MRFEEGNIYHVYNRGNNQQKLFLENDNYLFFLRKINDHLCPLVDVLAYCLMPNHFHLLIYVPEDVEKPALGDQSSDDSGLADDYVQEDVNTQIVNAIAVILRSYTRAINKRFKRSGSLFQQKTKAKDLTNCPTETPFICFHYIHQNPMKAKLVSKMEDWQFSSFQDYAGIRNGSICNKERAFRYLAISEDPVDFYKESYQVQLNEE